MNPRLKNILLPWIPPAMVTILRNQGTKYSFTGDYSSWNGAVRDSSGYNDDLIVQKVKDALLKVKRGDAAFERDSVAFNTPEYSWPLLASLLWVASKSHNRLHLIDLGGSLGSTYFQHQVFFHHLADVQWNIVEQKGFVECGRQYFADDYLKFFETLGEAQKSSSSNAILLSSVLQYLRDPWALLDEITGSGFEFVIIDRTPFIEGAKDRLTVQTVSPEIYSARYPAWFLSKGRFYDTMSKQYRLVAEFQGLDKANIASEYLGMMFEKKN